MAPNFSMNSSKTKVPPMKDLTIDNITENTIRINSQSSDPRLTYVLDRLVTHLHDFARETRLSTKEWMAALNFLTAVGQICSDVRQVCSMLLEQRCSSQLVGKGGSPSTGQPYLLSHKLTTEAKWQPRALESQHHASLICRSSPCIIFCRQ